MASGSKHNPRPVTKKIWLILIVGGNQPGHVNEISSGDW